MFAMFRPTPNWLREMYLKILSLH